MQAQHVSKARRARTASLRVWPTPPLSQFGLLWSSSSSEPNDEMRHGALATLTDALLGNIVSERLGILENRSPSPEQEWQKRLKTWITFTIMENANSKPEPWINSGGFDGSHSSLRYDVMAAHAPYFDRLRTDGQFSERPRRLGNSHAHSAPPFFW